MNKMVEFYKAIQKRVKAIDGETCNTFCEFFDGEENHYGEEDCNPESVCYLFRKSLGGVSGKPERCPNCKKYFGDEVLPTMKGN